MFCNHCGATISDSARFCGKCGEPQIIVVNSPGTPEKVSTEQPPTQLFPPLESMRSALAEQWTKQQESLVQLHRELDTKLMQQYADLTQQQQEHW